MGSCLIYLQYNSTKNKLYMKAKNLILKPLSAFVLLLVLASCGASRLSEDQLVSDSVKAKATISEGHQNIQELFTSSAGYAIFPNAGKGAYIIGGASGNGTVYENGTLVGYSNMKQVDVGLQAGGKAFIEVVFFQTQDALNKFKNGTYTLSGNASAVIIEQGASREVSFVDGVGVATMPKAGAMAGISVGGQKFEFRSLK